MSVSLKIISHSPSLDMYGEPDRSSAYSLSGQVTITLHPSSSLFERRRTTTYLLKSLNLTFEGQTEIIAPNIGYTALRLCRITREIAPSEPVELTNEGQEDALCQWDITFNIPIPGWLPETTEYGYDGIGTNYTLYADAKISVVDDPQTSTSIFNSLCTPFRLRDKAVHTSHHVMLRRFIDSHVLDTTRIPQTVYLINSKFATSSEKGRAHIPEEILSKIQVVGCVPEYSDVDSGSVALTVRLRTQGLSAEDCQRLELTGFTMNVVQREKCRYKPTDECRRRVPFPADREQPPNFPLRDPHRLGFIYDGFYSPPLEDAGHLREVSLLHDNECGEYKLVGDCHIFSNDAGQEQLSWYTVETIIPICSNPLPEDDDFSEYIGSPRLRPTTQSPLLSIRHEVRMALKCSYDLPNGTGKACELLTFAIPLKFSHRPPPPPVTTPIIALSTRSQIATRAPYTSIPYSQTSALPAYSQLFHSNGDRKIDPTPLPLYTSRDSHDRVVGSTSNDSNTPEPVADVGKLGSIPLVDYAHDYDASSETTLLL